MIAVNDLALESLIASLTRKTKLLVLQGDSVNARLCFNRLKEAISSRTPQEVVRLEKAKGLSQDQYHDVEEP